MSTINQTISPFPNDAPNRTTQTPVVFSANASSQSVHLRTVQTQLNTFGSQANALRADVNARAVSANSAATNAAGSASSAASSASAANSSRVNAENSATTSQGIVNGLDSLQYALSQIGIGFAGLTDGDLFINYANPITNVSLTNGELSITY